jgi:hypothetical protein
MSQYAKWCVVCEERKPHIQVEHNADLDRYTHNGISPAGKTFECECGHRHVVYIHGNLVVTIYQCSIRGCRNWVSEWEGESLTSCSNCKHRN